MSGVKTRPSSPLDIAAVTAIYAESVDNATGSFELAAPDAVEMERRMASLIDRGFPYFVAEADDGRILGFGYAGPYHLRPGYRSTVEDSIYLAVEARGQGIGGILLRQIIDASTQLGFRQMIAVIGDSANAASIRLHRAAGFTDIGALKDIGYKHGRWLDVVLMQRALGAGAQIPPDLS